MADGTGKREGALMELSFKSREKFASGNDLAYHSTLVL